MDEQVKDNDVAALDAQLAHMAEGEVVRVDNEAFMAEARARAAVAFDAWRENWQKWQDDLNFYSGETQWRDSDRSQRDAEGRPCLTLNQLPKFVRQVVGDALQNEIGIKVRPVESDRPGAATAKVQNIAGTKDYTYAEVLEGWTRSIEANSMATVAYGGLAAHVSQGGFGFLRALWRYARPDGFEKEIVIRRVRNPLSVLFDPDGMMSDEPLFTGARYCFIGVEMDRKAAEKRWKHVTSFDTIEALALGSSRQWWGTTEKTRAAEYFQIIDEETTYVLLPDGSVQTAAAWEQAALAQLNRGEVPAQPVLKRKGWKRRVLWALIDAGAILEGPYEWPGSLLPVAPALGPETLVNGRFLFESLIRHSHDAQRNFNYWRTAATEAVALAPKAPWLADAASVRGYEKHYEGATTKPRNLLLYNWREGVSGAVPPPRRMDPAGVPAAEIQQSMIASDDLKNTMGIYDAALGAASNEKSGRAILARQRESDTGTFLWHDAVANAVTMIGRILVDMIPRVFPAQQITRLRMPDGTDDYVRLNQEGADGTLTPVDLAAQRYDVSVTTGPSYNTQRQEAAAALLDFAGVLAQASPQAVMAIADRMAASMDWPGADDIARRLRKLAPPGVLSPSEREAVAAEMPEQPSQPGQEQLIEAKRLEAEAKKAEATIATAEADKAKAAVELAQLQAMAPAQVEDMVASALAEILPRMMGTTGQPMAAGMPPDAQPPSDMPAPAPIS